MLAVTTHRRRRRSRGSVSEAGAGPAALGALCALAALGWLLAEPARAGGLPEPQALGEAPAARVHWAERFDRGQLDWIDPVGHGPAKLAQVYSLRRDGALPFLQARHDVTARDPPPALHYGRAFKTGAAPLEKVRALRWRWRVLRHPAVAGDPWLDVAASVYVVIKTPSVIFSGKGFKFGWLARPGPHNTHQRGLLQVPLRSDPSGAEWRSESVDLCALYRKEYGPCEGERVLYVGVVTDADGTKSVAEAGYADFELTVAP